MKVHLPDLNAENTPVVSPAAAALVSLSRAGAGTGAEKGGRVSGGREACLVIVSGECCRVGVGVGVGGLSRA